MLSDHWKMPQKEWKMEFSCVNQRSTVGQRRVLKRFKSLPGASAAAIFTEMALKRVFYALWMQKRPSFSLCFIRFLGQPLTIGRGKISPEPTEKHKILNLISRNAFVDILLFLVAQKHNEITSTCFLFYRWEKTRGGELTVLFWMSLLCKQRDLQCLMEACLCFTLTS